MAVSYSPGTSDPGYQQLSGLYQAQSVEDAKKRQQSIQQALIDYGDIPDFGGISVDPNLLGTDVTDLVRGMASQNTQAGLSQTARMQKEHAENQRRIQDLLASRGMLQSGETGYQIGEEALAYKQTQYGALRALMDYIGGANTGFAQSERDRQVGLFQAQRDAALRQQEMQLNMQQAAAEQAFQAQQAAAEQAASQEFYEQLFPPQTEAPAGAAGGAAPSAWQLKVMQTGAKLKASARTEDQKRLFAQFAAWRAANPGWVGS